MNAGVVEEICCRLAESFPAPKTELEYDSHYMFLVAVVLSAQTTDAQVNRAVSKLFRNCQTPSEIIRLGLERLQESIKSIGLYRRKAENIIELSKILLEKYSGVVPSDKNQLMTLPGVGSKTANVILNVLFNQPTIAVDTHVLRVSGRLGLSESKNPIKVEEDLERIIPEHHKINIGHRLVLHGRYVCRARSPSCAVCCLADLCPSFSSEKRNKCS